MALLLNAGDTVQRSYSYTKPSPAHISQPEECGNLVESGEHAGQYAIPITLAGQTQTIYLSEPLRKIGDYADTLEQDGTVTRRIKKLVLTGNEAWYIWNLTSETYQRFFTDLSNGMASKFADTGFCSHFVVASSANSECIRFSQNNNLYKQPVFVIERSRLSTVDTAGIKQWLSDQYAAGTPVTVWYVLANATTETVTVPTLTPTKGSNTLSVGTTLQPSDVSITGGIK